MFPLVDDSMIGRYGNGLISQDDSATCQNCTGLVLLLSILLRVDSATSLDVLCNVVQLSYVLKAIKENQQKGRKASLLLK